MRLRFLILFGLLLAVSALFGQQPASASLTPLIVNPGDQISINTNGCSFGNGSVDGGEFTINVYGESIGPQTGYTFCASTTEDIYPGQLYTVESANTLAFDPSNPWYQEATWLFNAYSGAIAPAPSNVPTSAQMNASPGSGMSAFGGLTGNQIAGAMQYVFWQAENPVQPVPLPDTWTSNYATVNAVLGWDTASAGASLSSLFAVDEIVLDGGAQPQDLLTTELTPALTPVPEPLSLVVWSVLGAGAAGLAIRRRKVGRWSAKDRQAIMGMIETKVGH